VTGLAAKAPLKPTSRRSALGWICSAASITAATTCVTTSQPVLAETPDRLDVDDFLKRGQVNNPMGVSGQAGKSKPETGVILRDGSEVSRDGRTGDVLAEIVLQSTDGSKMPVLASYSSPWPLAKGTVFDVECRDAKTGDGAFLAVTSNTKGKTINDLKDSFFIDNLLSPTGRFSFYGPPTDVKVQRSVTAGDKRVMDLSFSTVSQATQTEIPRKARLVAMIPPNASQAVMLVASSSALRWNKGSEEKIATTIDSFRAIDAPKTSMRVRGKERDMSNARPGRL
jgi:hypothetical protein